MPLKPKVPVGATRRLSKTIPWIENPGKTRRRPPLILDTHPPKFGSRTEPLFCESRFGVLEVANCRLQAIRTNRSNVMKNIFCSLRVSLCESIRTNRPNSFCESPGHLSRFSLIRLRFTHGRVPAVPGFDSDGSCREQA